MLTVGRGGTIPPLYTVDSTHPEKWQTDVYDPAIKIIDAVLEVQLILTYIVSSFEGVGFRFVKI